MKAVAIFLSHLFISSLVFAGATTNELSCVAADNSFKLSGYVPGGPAEFDVNVTSKGLFSGRLYSEVNQQTNKMDENAKLELYDATDVGVFTLKLNNIDGGTVAKPQVIVSLHGLPKTFKKISSKNDKDEIIQFEAMVDTFIWPNAQSSSSSKLTKAKCKLITPSI